METQYIQTDLFELIHSRWSNSPFNKTQEGALFWFCFPSYITVTSICIIIIIINHAFMFFIRVIGLGINTFSA